MKLSECPVGPGQVQKTQNAMSNCLFALDPYISPMTNVLLTDLGLSIPLSFIDKCVSTSHDKRKLSNGQLWKIWWGFLFCFFDLGAGVLH